MIPGGARGSEDNGNTAASRNTAACAAFSLGLHENNYEKQAILQVKVHIPKKTLEAYDENR